MSAKCPKCHSENPADSVFCAKCGTQLIPPQEIPDQDAQPSFTKTLLTPVEDLTKGTLFAGRYEIIEELGKGGMGKVYKALDSEIQVEVAIKLLKPEIAADEKVIARFRNELKVAREIAHKNVCKVFHFGKEEQTPYITMEFVPGEDLKSLIQKKERLTEAEAISVAKQVCEGLMEAHRLGVIHRDLKPQNIMFDREGQAKIMDFGIARSVGMEGVTEAGMIIGTPDYISPEQAEGEEADHRSDIYSLGVILYEMVTGTVPFKGDTALSVALKHKSQLPQDPSKISSEISEGLSRLILICMEKERERRYQSAEDLLLDLTNIEQGHPLGAKVIPRRKPFAPAIKPKKVLIPALVVIALVIIGAVIWRLIPREEVTLLPQYEKSIAVISFENQTGDEGYDYLEKAIPNLLITNLEQSGHLYVATWERLLDLLEQLDKGDVGFIDRELGMELCRMDGVEAFVHGSFTKVGDMFASDVKVMEVKTGKLLNSVRSTGRGEESILQNQIDDLSKEIALSVGISDSDVEAAQTRIADITTTSLEAYNYYLKGREAYKKFYYDEAQRFYKKAVEIDPNFAMAYLRLGAMSIDPEAGREALEKAKALSARATDKERLFIEAFYALRIEKDQEKRFRILQEIAEKYPKDKEVHMKLGSYYRSRDKNKAIQEYEKVLELDPNDGLAHNAIGLFYNEIGDFEKAIEHLEKYASLNPGDANPIDSMAFIYFQRGRLDEAAAKYKKALEIQPDFYESMDVLAYIYALREDYQETMRLIDKFIAITQSRRDKAQCHWWKGFYNYWLGSFERSLSELSKAEEIAKSIGYADIKMHSPWLKAWPYLDRGEFDLSRESIAPVIDIVMKNLPERKAMSTVCDNLFSGQVDLMQGQIASLKSRLAVIKAYLPEVEVAKEWLEIRYNYLLGEMLLAEGSHQEAIAICEKTPPFILNTTYYSEVLHKNVPFVKDVLARAYLKKGDTDKAIAEYERLTSFDIRRQNRCLSHPRLYYRLAILYEEKGEKIKAIEKYEIFLDLWKDADEGLPEVEDAKTRHVALQN
jgi:tetratricopeptide (TPR) repeat protein